MRLEPEIMVRGCLAALLAFCGLLIVVPGMLTAPRPEAALNGVRAAGLALLVAAVFLCIYRRAQLPAGNPVLKRIVLRAAAVLLLLAWYVASEPFSRTVAALYCPVVSPAVQMFYSPLRSYVRSELPGARHIVEYHRWWYSTIRPLFD